MLNGNEIREIRQLEKEGISVVGINTDGTLGYSTQKKGDSEYCDKCSALVLLPDPDPDDWFRDEDKKAVCLAVDGVIERSLELPSEWINIRKPLYCPKLGRELSEEEKKKAAEMLKLAREQMK